MLHADGGLLAKLERRYEGNDNVFLNVSIFMAVVIVIQYLSKCVKVHHFKEQGILFTITS